MSERDDWIFEKADLSKHRSHALMVLFQRRNHFKYATPFRVDGFRNKCVESKFCSLFNSVNSDSDNGGDGVNLEAWLLLVKVITHSRASGSAKLRLN